MSHLAEDCWGCHGDPLHLIGQRELLEAARQNLLSDDGGQNFLRNKSGEAGYGALYAVAEL